MTFNQEMFTVQVGAKCVFRGLRESARQSGVSASTLSRIANGKPPDMQTFDLLLQWMQQDANTFFTELPVQELSSPEQEQVEKKRMGYSEQTALLSIAASLRTLAEVAIWYRQRVEEKEAALQAIQAKYKAIALEHVRMSEQLREQESGAFAENGDKNG